MKKRISVSTQEGKKSVRTRKQDQTETLHRKKHHLRVEVRDPSEILDGVDETIFETELEVRSELSASEYHAVLETLESVIPTAGQEAFRAPVLLPGVVRPFDVREKLLPVERQRDEEKFSEKIPPVPEVRTTDREKNQRRRQIDPTTCERDYSGDEIEFMNALDEYKRTSGRMFPTCSEILEVIRSLGYVKQDRISEQSELRESSVPLTPAFNEESETTVSHYYVSTEDYREPLMIF